MDSLSQSAVEYVHAGLVLVPVYKEQKRPMGKGWQLKRNGINTPEKAARLTGGIGLAHAWSHTCALDIDDYTGSESILRVTCPTDRVQLLS